jgi:hypothetical protein
MSPTPPRENPFRLLEDEIGRALAESQRSGELQRARNYGKPLDFGDGYQQTPVELRMGYKILKDAGVLPPEIEWMKQIEAQRLSLAAAEAAFADESLLRASRQRLAELQQQLALRLERLRQSGSL